MIRGKFMGFVAIGIGLLSGCSGEPAGSEGSASPVAGDTSFDVETATETELNVVHSLSFSDTHRVDFIHYGQGMVGLRESFHMDSDKGTTIFGDLKEGDELTLTELHQRAKPNEAVPSAIVRADALAAEEKLELQRILQEYPAELLVAPELTLNGPGTRVTQAPTDTRVAGGENIAKSQQGLGSCSSDYYGDNWGAAWYMQYFGFADPALNCPWTYSDGSPATIKQNNTYTNVGNWVYGISAQWGLSHHQLEGDFNNDGWTYAQMSGHGLPDGCPNNGQPCIGVRVLWNQRVPARMGYYFYASKSANHYRIDVTSTSAKSYYTGATCYHTHYNRTYCQNR